MLNYTNIMVSFIINYYNFATTCQLPVIKVLV